MHLRQIPLSLPIISQLQADGGVTLKSQFFEVFQRRPHGTWMTRPEIVKELVALGGPASRSSNPDSSVSSLLSVHKSTDGKKSFLSRRIERPGSSQVVIEFAMQSMMACEGCKLPRDNTQEMRVCDFCKAAWHEKCHKSKAPLRANRWFCSNLCSEKARGEKQTPQKQRQKPSGEVMQPCAGKRSSSVRESVPTAPSGEIHEEPQRSTRSKRNSTVPPEEVQEGEPTRSVRKRKSTVPYDQVQEEASQRSARKQKSTVPYDQVQEETSQRSARKQKSTAPPEGDQGSEGHDDEVRICILYSPDGCASPCWDPSAASAIHLLSHWLPFLDAGTVGRNPQGHETLAPWGIPPCKDHCEEACGRPGLPTLNQFVPFRLPPAEQNKA